MQDAVVYTDGSALPNPGKIGLGVAFVLGGEPRPEGQPIGIGSILTAELCALRYALERAADMPKLQNF